MPARLWTDEAWYSPGEVATATTNVEPPYTIRCIVVGVVEKTSEDAPCHVSVKTEWEQGVMLFEVVKGGQVVARAHAHVN